MDTITCEFCERTFKNKNVLDQHQKKTKYCLEIQGIENKKYKCEFCDKVLVTNIRLQTHLQSCKIKIKKELENQHALDVLKYEDQLKKFEQQKTDYQDRLHRLEEQLREKDRIIAEIALQPRGATHTDNRVQTVVMGQFDMTNVSRVSEVLDEFLDKNVVARGQQGLGEMIGTRLLRDGEGKPLYVCTDSSRQRFEFINTDGFTEPDPKALKLIRLINEAGLCVKTNVVVEQLYEMCREMGNVSPEVYSASIMELLMMSKDSSKFRSALATVTAKGAT